MFSLLLSGCATVDQGGKQARVEKQPTVISSIDFYGTELKFAWTFINPLPRPVKLYSYVWELYVGDKKLQRGQSRQVRNIQAGSSWTLELPAVVRHATLEKLLRTNSLPSQIPYRFTGRATLGGQVHTWSYDLADEGKVNLLSGPGVDIQRFRIKKMDEARANVAVEIIIRNANTFPTQLSNFSADLILAGQTIAQGVEGPARAIEANGSAIVPLDLDLNFASLGQVVYHALNQQESDFTLYGKTEVSTPWGTKKLNYDQSGKVRIERDGTKP